MSILVVEILLKGTSTMKIEPKYHDVRLRLSTLDGNALGIVGAACAALRKAGVASKEIEIFADDALSGDYSHVLRTTAGWVQLTT